VFRVDSDQWSERSERWRIGSFRKVIGIVKLVVLKLWESGKLRKRFQGVRVARSFATKLYGPPSGCSLSPFPRRVAGAWSPPRISDSMSRCAPPVEDAVGQPGGISRICAIPRTTGNCEVQIIGARLNSGSFGDPYPEVSCVPVPTSGHRPVHRRTKLDAGCEPLKEVCRQLPVPPRCQVSESRNSAAVFWL